MILIPLLAKSAPPELDPQKDLPRFPPVEAGDVLKTFQIKNGFKVELVAAEPDVTDPIALSFDEDGRMFVVDMNDYSERRDEHLGKIRMLEDVDGDGRFEKSTVFADHLPWPTSVICYDGGIFVAASPDILYLKDTDGDGIADIRKVVFTGFGNGMEKLNVQALVNGFNWGLDNKIHGATAPNGGVVTNLTRLSSKPLNLQGRDFYFDPATMELFAENGGGQYGLSFDSKGRKFVCSNSHHLQTLMYEARYAERNPFYAMPGALVDIAVDGPAAEVYRISPEEPWRVIRTRWRVNGIASGPIEGGGRSAGYFTGATGVTIYRGNAFPKSFLDNAFIGDAGGNLVHRKIISPDGPELEAQRPEDEQKVEFLASTDTWFRPVQFANAPDGTLYVIDMYREIIEHPWSLPEQIKKHLDLNSGNDRGRIYRIEPDNFRQPKPPRLGKASSKDLVKILANENGWHRDTAARLLFERRDKTAVPALLNMAEKSKSAQGRLHALYTLEGLDELDEKMVEHSLQDTNETVRQHAVLLSENFFRDGKVPSPLMAKLAALKNDPSVNVRYQLAFTLGQTVSPEKASLLAEIARRDHTNAWMCAAVLSSLAQGAGDVFNLLSHDGIFSNSESAQKFLADLAEIIAAKNDTNEVAVVLRFLSSAQNTAILFPVTRSFAEGAKRSGGSLQNWPGIFEPVFSRASAIATNQGLPEATRLEAVQILGFSDYTDNSATLSQLLAKNEAPSLQQAAVEALGKFLETDAAQSLIGHFSALNPRARSEAITILLARPERATLLLDAVETKTVPREELSSTQIKFLQSHGEATVREKAGRIFAEKG
ncbi:MAG: PVC-type heme-binding CxxCH protein, partial [Verrucomicrobiota bacterium]